VAFALVLLVAACSRTVGGDAQRTPPSIDEDSRSPIDIETVMLDRSRMRAVTGAGEQFNIIPSMDGKIPVDIDQLAGALPDECGWLVAETQIFGPELEEFHKTTFQNPPAGGQISQAAAAYRDADTARRAFQNVAGLVASCADGPAGPRFIGEWTSTPDAVSTRTGDGCGRDYRLKWVVLAEVAACGFGPAVPDLVLTNMLASVPG
jgi:hypothetical protein